jgi:hypothetical protein
VEIYYTQIEPIVRPVKERKHQQYDVLAKNRMERNDESIMSTNDFCNGCGNLKGSYQGVRRSYVIFCSKTGLNLSGTLERQDKCKRDNLKSLEVSHAKESSADCPSEDKRS